MRRIIAYVAAVATGALIYAILKGGWVNSRFEAPIASLILSILVVFALVFALPPYLAIRALASGRGLERALGSMAWGVLAAINEVRPHSSIGHQTPVERAIASGQACLT